MSEQLLRAAALAAVLLPATCAVAASLSLEQALDLAVRRSEMARSARAGAIGAVEIARAAGQQPDPMLKFGVENVPITGRDRLSTNAEDMTMKRIGIAQEWVAADKRASRAGAAHAMARREAAMEGVAVGEARLQTALAYVDAYYAEEALKLTTLNLMHAREELEAGKGRLATVSGSSAEVLALGGALGAAEDESGDVRQQRGTAAATLQRWIGVAAEALSPPRVSAALDRESYVAAHPVVVARERDLDVARQEVEVARLNRKPNWTYEISYGQRQRRPDMVSFEVRIPFPVAPAARQDRETAAKQALVEKSEAELDEARRAAAGEHAALSSDQKHLNERIARFHAGVLAPLKQRVAAALAAYRSNQASLAMVFEARHAEVEAQRKLLALQRDLAKVQVQLAFKPASQGAVR